MAVKIVFLDAATLNMDGRIMMDRLFKLGDVTLYERTVEEDVISRCENADIIIVNKVMISREVIKACHTLKYIAVCATGVNNVDLFAARSRSIPVSNVAGYGTESVVQHTFSLILSLIHSVEKYTDKIRKGKWRESGDFCFYDHSVWELNGKTMGIVGYGHIGKRVAEVGAAFGMKVLAYKRSPETEIKPLARLVPLDVLLSESDIVSLHAPLNDFSSHIINEESLSLMKKNALLINTARGGLIDEKALYRSLKDGRIGGAGLDTLSSEPPEDGHFLLQAPRCLITPHMAWTSVESRQNLINGVCDNINSYLNGKALNVVNGTFSFG
ncbi:MAG TPA: D-2-hydroxyacid dehydrogenase [Saprospiraceae bacterium]|nr:D-2-hydroxyacid dehydrogenase [Saprospiraceae bacterium]